MGALAGQGSMRHWRAMGATSPAEAKGSLAWLLRRRWAMTALRENARLLLSRLEYVGSGITEAVQRRTAAATAAEVRARQSVLDIWRGPRTGGLGSEWCLGNGGSR